MTVEVKTLLNTFDAVGIAPRERFLKTPDEYNPKRLLNSFQSIIVFGEGGNEESNDMSEFKDSFGSVLAQVAVIDYLKSKGLILLL